MTPVFPLDGPCTQLRCLSCCSLPLTFPLIDFWPTNGNQQPVTNSLPAAQGWPLLLLLIVNVFTNISCIISALSKYYVTSQNLITQTFSFFFCHPTDQNITSDMSLRWEGSRHDCYSPHLKTTAVTLRVQRVPFRWGSRSSDACYWDHFTTFACNHPLSNNSASNQLQKEKLCEREARNSLKWGQCLIVGCEMSLTTWCWTYFPFTAVMDFPSQGLT